MMAVTRKHPLLFDGRHLISPPLMQSHSPEGGWWPWLASTHYYSTADT